MAGAKATRKGPEENYINEKVGDTTVWNASCGGWACVPILLSCWLTT